MRILVMSIADGWDLPDRLVAGGHTVVGWVRTRWQDEPPDGAPKSWSRLMSMARRVGARRRGEISERVFLQPTVAQRLDTLGIPRIDCTDCNTDAFVRSVREMSVDLIIVAGYPTILRAPLLAAPFRGVINCHHSLLPAYRGPQPVYWAIRNGETRTGVSVNVMTERIDEGTLLAQVAVQIFPTDTGGSVLAKLNEAASPLVADVVSQIARGETRSVNSMVDRASYFGGRTIDDVQIDWHRTSIEILNQLRAVRPWNGLECSVNGVPLLVRRAEAVACRPGRAGGVVSIKRRGLTVRTRDGGILLTDFSVRPLHGRTGQCGAILLLQLSQILSLTD